MPIDMTNRADTRVTDLSFPGLADIFDPPGVPLIAKGSRMQTTSIVVRGGPGSGKTTLAIALAHGISKHQGGVALYLHTEFVATEVAYKAVHLRLPEGCVKPGAPVPAIPGDIFVEHLRKTSEAAFRARTDTVAARKRASIEAAWTMATDGKGIGQPVRVVVIDAFALPDGAEPEVGLRNELLELVQALESVGISTIVVEETCASTDSWLPFIVDVVIETVHVPGCAPRIRCTKSRYAGPKRCKQDEDQNPGTSPSDDVPACPCCGARWDDPLFGDADAYHAKQEAKYQRYLDDAEYRIEINSGADDAFEVELLPTEVTVRGRKFKGDRVWVFSCPLCRAEHDTDIVILGDEVK